MYCIVWFLEHAHIHTLFLTIHLFLYQIPQEPEMSHRGKISQSYGGGSDSKPESSHLRHATSTDLSHISRISRDTVSPSYQSPMSSPMSLTHKPDLSVQKGPPAFLPTPPPVAPQSSSLYPRPDSKLEHSGHRSVDMVQLMTVKQQINQLVIHEIYFQDITNEETCDYKTCFFFTEIPYCMARYVGTEE